MILTDDRLMKNLNYTEEELKPAIEALKRIESRYNVSDYEWARTLAEDFVKVGEDEYNG